MRRYADKRDINEPDIIKFLKRCGCTVQQLSMRGVPDLLVGFQGYNLLLEVKTPSGDLTTDQAQFFKKWGNSQVSIVRSRTDAKKVLKEFMPVRIYECPEHGLFEKKQKFSEEPLTQCTKCDKIVKQKYSIPYIVYKGNGWYGKDNSSS